MTQIRTSRVALEAPLTEEALSVLRAIGVALNERHTVRVKDEGIVTVDQQPEPEQEKEFEHEPGPQGPAAGSRQRTARRKGSSRSPRAPRTRPRIRGLTAAYQRQVEDVESAYPGATFYSDEHGLWLFAHSRILEGFGRRAAFLIALPNSPDVDPCSWGFWDKAGEYTWIGPRHTNFPDGSVCAFARTKDNIWSPGGDLRTLLDIYSVWALRHLHLEFFGRWAGRQYCLLDQFGFPDPYYRLMEFNDDELCSCNTGKRYGQCCKPQDLRLNLLTLKAAFEKRNARRNIRDRHPPASVVTFLNSGGSPPAIIEVHDGLRHHLNP